MSNDYKTTGQLCMEALRGRTISAVWRDGTERLKFDTDIGPIIFAVDGDCCSSSYFNDLIGVGALIGATVREAEEVNLPCFDEGNDFVQVYGHKVVTEKGHAEIIFRSSSNGYYGGRMFLVESDSAHYHWTPVTEDWMA